MLRGLSLMGESLDGILGVEFLVVLLYILIPTTLFGATFPIVAGIYNDGSSRRGGNIGRIYAANTAGCILGSTVAAFVLLPGLGSALSIKAAAALNILVAAAGFAVLGRPRLFFASAALLALPLLPVHVSQELLNSGVAIYGKDSDYSLNSPDSILLYSKEGLNATISVVTKPDGNMVLRTNGKADASTVDDMSTQVALGYFPLLLHQRPEKVLVIGFGSGSTVKAVEDFPGVTGIDCIEIEPAVLEAAEFFREVNGGAHRSPRVRMIVDDARNQIIASGRRYDVIISEPSNPWISGIGNLFSREFYEASLSRLNKGGIFCQWVQLYRMRQEDLRMILRTFSSVFTDVSVWQSGPGDILLMGSGERMGAFQKRAVAQRLTGKVAWDLKAYLNISDATDFFSYFVTDSEGVDAMAAGARVNTDDLPLLEFNAPFSLYAEDAYKSNNMLLLKHTKLPDIAGMGASAHDSAELLYRKSTNYLKLHIPVDPEWVKRTMEFAFARDNPATDYEYAMLMKDSDGKAADFHFERAIALKGDEFDYLYEAAKFRLQRGRAREALDYFFRARELPHYASEEWRLFGYIALSYRQLGDYRNYVAYLVKSVEANPYNSNAQLALADSYLQNGDRDAACARFEDALKYAPAGDRAALRGKTSRYCRP
jgi:spermidine synthase/tetratricopeptide (TPR) repeat protein